MNSKIYKRVGSFDPATLMGYVSGNVLSKKLEAWCEISPGVLLWEVELVQGSVRPFINREGKEEDKPPNWSIEFHIVRANSVTPDKYFDGVFVLAGVIRNSLELVEGVSKEAYLLSLSGGKIKGEQVFVSVRGLWETLTTLGLKPPEKK